MSVTDKHTTDDWDAEVVWGKDVIGDASENDNTIVNIETRGTMTDDSALALADWLTEQLRGDER